MTLKSYSLDDFIGLHILGEKLVSLGFLSAVFELVFHCTNGNKPTFTVSQITYILVNRSAIPPFRKFCIGNVDLWRVSGHYKFTASKGDDNILPTRFKSALLTTSWRSFSSKSRS